MINMILDWLLTPIDPTRLHTVGVFVSWHARLMVIAWAFLVPIAILAARYFKILPWQNWPNELDNQVWWGIHRICQYLAAVLMLVAVGLILNRPEYDSVKGWHAVFGWIVLSLVVVQVIGGLLRGSKGGPTERHLNGNLRGDHFDMSRRRVIFEYTHKTVGHVALLMSIVTILLGLWHTNAPRWMWLILGIWWLALAGLFALLQQRKLSVDTYQSIWGPDPALPGNQRKPIGFGIHRLPGVNDKNH